MAAGTIPIAGMLDKSAFSEPTAHHPDSQNLTGIFAFAA
jgi:hypothetical protein